MASLGEMLAYAQAVQAGKVQSRHPDTEFADSLSRVAPAFQAGITAEHARKQKELENTIKMIEAAKTIKETEELKLANEITKNIGKQFGIIDYDDEEIANVRKSINDSIGSDGDTKNPYAGSKTKKGKMFNMLSDMEKQIDYSTKTGFKISFKDKEGKSGSGADDDIAKRREKIWDKATEMAINEEVERLGKTDEAKYLGLDRRAFTPRPDIVNKYLPVAEEWLYGTKDTYKDLFKQKRGELILPDDFNP